MRRSLTLLATVAILIGMVAAPAAAGAPEIFEDEIYDWTDELNPLLTDECGFDVFQSGHETVVVKGFFDRHGELIRVGVHVNGTNMTYKKDGPELVDRYAFHVTEDIVSETATYSGNVWNVHTPGSGTGVVINDSGHITFTFGDVLIKTAGPKDSLKDGFPQDLCDALNS